MTNKRKARVLILNHSKGLSPKGLWNGESFPFGPPPPGLGLGGGLGGDAVIITREMELSRITLVISGLVYGLPKKIFLDEVFKRKI